MVTAEYDTKHSKLTVTGHAGAAEKGKDLICAGVTTLVEALNVALDEMGNRGWLADGEAKLADGAAFFQAFGKEGCKMAVHGAFQTAVSGLQWLAANYPEYVQINIF